MVAKPLFIVSSGRAGSAMMEKALGTCDGLEMHHEYHCTDVQTVAVKRYMGLASSDEVNAMVEEIYAPSLERSDAKMWGDSSNKLSWIIPELAARFPDAKFVHVTRDGRKVASSYLHKLGRECYDDEASAALAAHVADPSAHPAPPPSKRYWWPQPQASHPLAADFANFNQFQRIGFHWAEINQVIFSALEALPANRSHFVRLEDLVDNPAAIGELTDFLGVTAQADLFSMFQRPHNVNRPQDTSLTAEQTAQFEALGGEMMARLGYAGTPEYRVAYQSH